MALAAWSACGGRPGPSAEGSGQTVLKPLPAGPDRTYRHRELVYVPVYSSIYWGFDGKLSELAATLSIRNVSPAHAIVIRSVAYYDSDGRKLREYLRQPGSLAPLATADFVIQRTDKAGGPGANFLVEWASSEDVDEPLIEAVMIGQHGNAGISFTGAGRRLRKASAALGAGN